MVLVFLENVSVSRANFSARDRKFSVFPWNSSISARCERSHLKLGRIFNPTSKTRCSEASLGLRTGRREFLQNYRRWNSAKHARNTRKTRAKHAHQCMSITFQVLTWLCFIELKSKFLLCIQFRNGTTDLDGVCVDICLFFRVLLEGFFSVCVCDSACIQQKMKKNPRAKPWKNRQISIIPDSDLL